MAARWAAIVVCSPLSCAWTQCAEAAILSQFTRLVKVLHFQRIRKPVLKRLSCKRKANPPHKQPNVASVCCFQLSWFSLLLFCFALWVGLGFFFFIFALLDSFFLLSFFFRAFQCWALEWRVMYERCCAKKNDDYYYYYCYYHDYYWQAIDANYFWCIFNL